MGFLLRKAIDGRPHYGRILLDDSTLDKDEVRLVMPEVMATGRYELVARNPYHLFRKSGDGKRQ